MPFSPQDARRHKKDISPGAENRWAAIANSVLATTNDEGKAIRIANGVTRSKLQHGRRR